MILRGENGHYLNHLHERARRRGLVLGLKGHQLCTYTRQQKQRTNELCAPSLRAQWWKSANSNVKRMKEKKLLTTSRPFQYTIRSLKMTGMRARMLSTNARWRLPSSCSTI